MSFSQSIFLELFKAIFTAVFVAGGAAFVVWRFQATNDERRAATERALDDAARDRDLARSDQALANARALQLEKDQFQAKSALVARASDLAGAFYFRTQQRERQNRDPATWGSPVDQDFDMAYLDWATRAEGFEKELGVWFGWSGDVVRLWHQTRDLLTVRYFALRGRSSPSLRRTNSKSETEYHSGLTADELADDDVLLKTYRAAMPELLRTIMAEGMSM